LTRPRVAGFEVIGDTLKAEASFGVLDPLGINDCLKPGVPHPKWIQRNETFFKEAAIDISNVKDTWRNPCVHRIEKRYTPPQAEEVYDSVKKLMQRLAGNLTERRRKGKVKPA